MYRGLLHSVNQMEKQVSFLFIFLFLSITTANKVALRGRILGERAVKLFVFGDSYADTGNWPKDSGVSSWNEPYGFTFPGKPSGRFSDGLILTDYIASYFGIESPIPYKQRKSADEKMIRNGMNFAHGGTGVFNTLDQAPNMTEQIKLFEQVIDEEKVYNKQDLIMNSSSIALVSLGGNDYATYFAFNGTPQGLGDFSKLVVKQLEVNLKRIHDIGVERILVTAMEPLGCLPRFTASTSYRNCSENGNSASQFHNQLLEQSLNHLNDDIISSRRFVKLDLYKAFMSVLNIQQNHPSTGTSKFENVLKPCCEGACGSLDKNGIKTKKYTVCQNPNQSFFWDMLHPSQQGWQAVSSALRSSLYDL